MPSMIPVPPMQSENGFQSQFKLYYRRKAAATEAYSTTTAAAATSAMDTIPSAALNELTLGHTDSFTEEVESILDLDVILSPPTDNRQNSGSLSRVTDWFTSLPECRDEILDHCDDQLTRLIRQFLNHGSKTATEEGIRVDRLQIYLRRHHPELYAVVLELKFGSWRQYMEAYTDMFENYHESRWKIRLVNMGKLAVSDSSCDSSHCRISSAGSSSSNSTSETAIISSSGSSALSSTGQSCDSIEEQKTSPSWLYQDTSEGPLLLPPHSEARTPTSHNSTTSTTSTLFSPCRSKWADEVDYQELKQFQHSYQMWSRCPPPVKVTCG